MPNVTLHLVLADRVLDAWRSDPSAAPFDPEDPALVNAFQQGSLGPDIGYFPGSDPFLSDLAHYVRSGDLTRALAREAEHPRERAFVRGWLSHVLADAAIHPLVGEAVGEHLDGRRGRYVGISDDRTSHVRVEVGLDATYAERNPGVRSWRGEPVFHAGNVDYLGRAYRRTYGLEFDPALLMASHATATRMANRAVSTIGVMGRARAVEGDGVGAVGGARWLLERALAVVREGLDRESMLLAFLNPIPPSGWLLERVQRIVDGFPERMAEFSGEGVRALPNYNLDTGRVEDDGPGTHCGRMATRRLEELGGTAFRPADEGGPPARYPGPRVGVGSG